MRLLIAGWQGQVARALVEMAPGRPDVMACAVGRAALDICEAKSIERALSAISPTVVINSAAYTAVDKAESEPERAFALNRDGARLLAEASAKRGIPMIHISTDYVFDGTKQAPYTEEDATSPATVFGRSKLEGEEAVRATNPKHLILRTSWIFSPTGRNFVRTMLSQAGEHQSVRVVDDQRGSPTYAPHLVNAILDLAATASKPDADVPWGIYNVANTGTTTWRGFAEEVFDRSRALGGPSASVAPIRTADYPTPAPRPANSQLDCSKLERTFGLRLPPWQTGVADCVGRLLAD
ncbi:dTDP-4-dehydrorhamnose reductase [Hyphomicrobium sp. NDB2Meth4]|uniref:dTDP-4-dehydrorhamnose reductase n=1 Tax=Hyphomicrobium sp. NDB2Meth4 TaxID=1892846 RepID=UPI000930AC7E|nr:dTDP-4-dehydrorhamnose reductase [Hyphomicrobium sp. NDB2Meth4]